MTDEITQALQAKRSARLLKVVVVLVILFNLALIARVLLKSKSAERPPTGIEERQSLPAEAGANQGGKSP